LFGVYLIHPQKKEWMYEVAMLHGSAFASALRFTAV